MGVEDIDHVDQGLIGKGVGGPTVAERRGTTSITWEPTLCSWSPCSHPSMTCAMPSRTDWTDAWSPCPPGGAHVVSKTLPSLQRTPVKRTVTTMPDSTCGPFPRISGCTTRSDGGSAPAGTVTVGAPSSSSVTVGRPFAGSTAAPAARVGSTSTTSTSGTSSCCSRNSNLAPTRCPDSASWRFAPSEATLSSCQAGASTYVDWTTVPSRPSSA